MNILALNAGSNSLRLKLIAMAAGAERILTSAMRDHVRGTAVAEASVAAVKACRPLGIDAIGVRVVHGACRRRPERVTPQLLEEIRQLAPLAPLHVPTDLGVIEAVMSEAPGIPVFAVFDTSFHQTMPERAWRYALPEEVGTEIRRYGFHGLAHAFLAGELFRISGLPVRGSRVVSLHLGGGASICALADGKSVDTSMGLTPLEGLMMSTRSGDIDPGAVLALFRSGRSAEEVETLLTRRSGLLGLSGLSDDLRDLEPAAKAGNTRAEFALDAYAYRVRKYIGAYAAALGGLDAVVISGALAENSPGLRARVLAGLEFLDLAVDPAKNAATRHDKAGRLSPDKARVAVWMIPAEEEIQIARDVFAVG